MTSVPRPGTRATDSALPDPLAATCPAPRTDKDTVLVGHGSGGQLSQRLMSDVIGPALAPAAPGGTLNDAAIIRLGGVRLAFTTDSYLVSPLFFPGGDIGKLAVHGTINDLAMMGALPKALSLAFIVEEGLHIDDLRRVVESVADAAQAADVEVVTGDTKVVGRGAADRLFVNTAGVGAVLPAVAPAADRARPGDCVIVSGSIARHGMTIMSVREGLDFDSDITSDSQPLHRVVEAAFRVAPGPDSIRVLRDPTRGGLASSLCEIAASSSVSIEIDQDAIPIPSAVSAACEMLGLDPLHVANEGCCVAIVSPDAVDDVLAAWRARPEACDAVLIGHVREPDPGRVFMRTTLGSRRIVDMLMGEQLPRIC